MKSQWAVGSLRDYWPRASAACIENGDWLQHVDCFRPKFLAAPLQGAVDVAANGYLVLTLALVPGSWLVAMSQVNAASLDFNLTDISTGHKFFSSPTPVDLVSNSGGFFSPWYMPEPYMMAGNALLRVELWNATAATVNNAQLVLHVLEPREV